MGLLLAKLTVVALSSWAASASPAEARPGSWLSELRAYDQRAAAIGYRLAVAALPQCDRTTLSLGVTLDGIERYQPSDQADAARELGLAEELRVSAVVPGAAGDKAGLRVGDDLVAIDGKPLSAPPSGARAQEAQALIDHLVPGRLTVIKIRRGATTLDLVAVPEKACDAHLVLSTRGGKTTFTDGHDIDVSAGLFRFAASDDEVAFAAAHEFAHAILNQRRSPPRSLRDKKRTEINADILGVALMAQAGFDPGGAVIFWTKFGANDAWGFLRSPSHPTTKHRLEKVREAVERIESGLSPSALIHEAVGNELGA